MAEITFDTGAGDAVHEPWGPGGNQYFHFKRATGSTGDSPTCIFIHGTPEENASGGNAIQPFIGTPTAGGNANGNPTCEYMLARGCNIVSLAMERKLTLTDGGLVDSHSQGPPGTGLFIDNVRSGATYVPELYLQIRRAVCYVKYWVDRAGYGDPAKFVGLGYSYGSWLHMMAQIREPIYFDGMEYRDAASVYDRPGVQLDSSTRSTGGTKVYDSRLRALGNAQGQPDLRRGVINPQQTPAILSYHAGIEGGAITSEYDTVPDTTLEQMSLLWFLERGLTRWWVPMISGYPAPSGGSPGLNPLTDPHDPVQGQRLAAACRARHLEHRLLPNVLEAGGNIESMADGLLRYVA